jgi:hypothetical protein
MLYYILYYKHNQFLMRYNNGISTGSLFRLITYDGIQDMVLCGGPNPIAIRRKKFETLLRHIEESININYIEVNKDLIFIFSELYGFEKIKCIIKYNRMKTRLCKIKKIGLIEYPWEERNS